MLLEVLIENLALGAVKLINLPLKKKKPHITQTRPLNLICLQMNQTKHFGFLKV